MCAGGKFMRIPILNKDPMDVIADRIINREKYMMDRACMTDWEKTQEFCQRVRAEMDARSEALCLERPIFTPNLEAERMMERMAESIISQEEYRVKKINETVEGGLAYLRRPIVLDPSVAKMFGLDIDE